MNSERRMDLIQLITRTDGSRVTTISRSPGRREPSPQRDFTGLNRRVARIVVVATFWGSYHVTVPAGGGQSPINRRIVIIWPR